MKKRTTKAPVAICMGSDSDWSVMKEAADALKMLGVRFEAHVLSAHRTPIEMFDYAQKASGNGIEVIIAGAGGAAHLPGMMAALTHLPIIGVPVPVGPLKGMDALLSIVQMPKGVPVATVAIGNAFNAGLLAAQILSSHDPKSALTRKLKAYKADLRQKVKAKKLPKK